MTRVVDFINTPTGMVGVIGDARITSLAKFWQKGVTYLDLGDRPDLTIDEALEAISADPREIEFILVDRHIPAKWGSEVGADSTNVHCNYCTKHHDEVKKLIAGPGVYICNECIDLCHGILHETPPQVQKARDDLHALIVITLQRHGHLPVYELADQIVAAVVEGSRS